MMLFDNIHRASEDGLRDLTDLYNGLAKYYPIQWHWNWYWNWLWHE